MRFNPSKLPRAMMLWAGLVALNSLPSFIIAVQVEFRPQIPAILAGVATLWVGYVLAHCVEGVIEEGGVGSRALRLAVKIRTGIALLSLFFAPFKDVIYLAPDFWSGFAAGWILMLVGTFMPGGLVDFDSMNTLLAYLLTVTEGLLVSFLMLMLAFFILLILQRREGRKAMTWPAEGPPPESSNSAPPAA